VKATWHDVECGAYTADLGLWEDLADDAGGPVLDLGCGTGRVALHLARRGHEVIGIDSDAELVEALAERGKGLALDARLGDARDFSLDADVALALAPMQLVQLFSNRAERLDFLHCVSAQLQPGGRVAAAIVEQMPAAEAGLPPLPDVREADGWVYSSLPLEATEEGGEIAIRRLRQTVSPAGELSEEEDEVRLQELSAASLEAEGAEAGLSAADRREIPPTDLHVGSTVVVLDRES
jgi:SAM-dependent methyltransferase